MRLRSPSTRLRNGAVKSPARDRSPVVLVSTFARNSTHELQSLDVARASRRDPARVCRLHVPRPLYLRHLPGLRRTAARICSAAGGHDCDARPGLSVAAAGPEHGSAADVAAVSFADAVSAAVTGPTFHAAQHVQ